jgi:hypothetical protein
MRGGIGGTERQPPFRSASRRRMTAPGLPSAQSTAAGPTINILCARDNSIRMAAKISAPSGEPQSQVSPAEAATGDYSTGSSTC